MFIQQDPCVKEKQTTVLNPIQALGILAVRSYFSSWFLVALWKISSLLVGQNVSIVSRVESSRCQDMGELNQNPPSQAAGALLGKRLSFARQWPFSQNCTAPVAAIYLQSIINEYSEGLQTLDIATALCLNNRASAPKVILIPIATERGSGKGGWPANGPSSRLS